jgi:PAS domain S-box-containing protein
MNTNYDPEKDGNLLLTIFNSMTEGVVVIDSNGEIIKANPAAARILGLNLSDIEGRLYNSSDWKIIRPDKTPMPVEEMPGPRVMAEKKALSNIVMGMFKQDHSITWINVSAVPIISQDDIVDFVIGTFIDITEMKMAEDELKFMKDALQNRVDKQTKESERALIESEQRYRSLFEFMIDGFLRADINGFIVMANMAIAKMCGYKSPDEMIGLHMTGLYANANEREKILQNIHKMGVVHNFEILMKTKDGSYFWSLSSVKTLNDENGNIIGTEGLIRDITDRKKAEDALRESEERFRQIYEHMSVGIAKVSLSFFIESANEAYCQMIGYTEDELIGKHLQDITAPETLKENLLKQSQLATGVINHFRMEKKFIHKNGNIIDGLLDANTVHDANGKPLYFLGSVLDLTERNKLDKQIQQTQKMEAIGTLAGGIAHDFNNLLNVFTGNISYALSCLKEGDELFDVLSDVMIGTKQAENLTHQLLTFAKGGKPIKKLCNINTILEKASRFVTSGAKSKCEFKLASNLWAVEVDPGQLTQVISNLVINADQSMSNGGIISISSENIDIEPECDLSLSPGQYVKICFEDTGTGIKEENLSFIYDPYFTTKKNGNGLGLTTSYSIIKKHNGHIFVSSEYGLGTVVSVFLPAFKQSCMEPIAIHDVQHDGHGKILVMDDQEPILKMVARMLKRMGYDVEIAFDGEQAIQIYQKAYQSQKPFDLVILDLTIPGGMGGAETMVELLKINPQVKAIVSSGYSNDPIMAHYKDYGFSGVVPKPYTKNELSDVLNKIYK